MAEQLQCGTAEAAADPVERHGDLPAVQFLANAFGPAGPGVVDGDRRAEPARDGGLGRPARHSGDRRAHVYRGLDEQAADPARRAEHQHHVLGRQTGDVQDAYRGAAGADGRHGRVVGHAVRDLVHRGRLAYGQLRVTAGGQSEAGDDAPAQPARLNAVAE
nr:hypothetical protein [Nonomuraea basaltis]